MGKSGKLFKSLVAGVKVFKSPSKERPVKEKSTPHANRKEDKDYVVSMLLTKFLKATF